jgi:hypothetical protein
MIYAEKPRIKWKGQLWGHLIADSLEELHLMAKTIGLKPEWFQDKKHKHYDITESMYQKAILHGAIPCKSALRSMYELKKGR